MVVLHNLLSSIDIINRYKYSTTNKEGDMASVNTTKKTTKKAATSLNDLNANDFPQSNATNVAAGPDQPMGLDALLGGIRHANALSSDARMFDKRLCEICSSLQITEYKGGLTSAKIFSNADGRNAVVVIYAEVGKLSNTLACEYGPEVTKAFLDTGNPGDKSVDQFIVVKESMYGLADLIGNRILNIVTLKSEQAEKFTVNSFDKTQLITSSDLSVAKELVAQCNPSDVVPRADFGLTLSRITNPKLVNSVNINENAPQYTPILSILAYVDFIKENTGLTNAAEKFTPLITISSIASPLPHAEIGALAISFAVESFIKNYAWLNQFNLSGKLVKGAKNIGNLITRDGSPFVCKTQADVNNFVADHINVNGAKLAIDVKYGDFALSGLDLMTYREDLFTELFSRFFNHQEISSNAAGYGIGHSICETRVEELVGSCRLGSEVVDSRYLDYLYFIANAITPDEVAPLQMLYSGDARIKLQESIIGSDNLTITDRCQKVVLAPWFVDLVGNNTQPILDRTKVDYLKVNANAVQLTSGQYAQLNYTHGNSGGNLWKPQPMY